MYFCIMIDAENKLKALQDKYSLTGQSLEHYLEGLLLSNYLSYWDYVHLDTLLSLQNPRTDFPDEKIFIVYHQITELYFNLCLHELDQIANNGVDIQENGHVKGNFKELSLEFFKERLKRLNRYFDALIYSFEIMIEGMQKEQFTKFRMALLPASGFQSAQYRKIEMASTDLVNLVHKDKRDQLFAYISKKEVFDLIYWKEGAIDADTHKKTFTLKQFEKKYADDFEQFAQEYDGKNLWQKYLELKRTGGVDDELIELLKSYDHKVNVAWPMAHMRSAARYLEKKSGKSEKATGGTNWKKYLPPRFQMRIFYPELYSESELKNWGKN